MTHMRRRIFSILLTCAMLLSLLPVTALAAGEVSTADGLKTALSQGGEVTLGANITGDFVVKSNVTVTLDLNGQTLTNSTGDTITVEQGASLTITGSGTVDNKSNGKAAIFNNGTVVLSGGIYDRTSETGASADISGDNSWYTICNHGNMTINSGVAVKNTGSFSSMIENGYYSYTSEDPRSGHKEDINSANPSLTINGGTFTGGLNSVKNDDGGILTINGGTFTNTTQAAVLNWNKATITGGTFTVDAAGQNCILNGTTAAGNASAQDLGQLTITGGSFTSPADIASVANNFKDVAPAITGGTFSSDVRAYVDRSSNVTKGADGNFVIIPNEKEDGVAEISGKYYKTLGDAIASVGDGDTIQVLKDIPDAVGISVPSGKNFTIDFGGHTYTLTGPGAGSPNTKTNGFQLLKDSTITMKNGTIRIAEDVNNIKIKRIIQNYADLTLENMQFYAENQVGGEDYALSFNNGNVTFKGNTSVFTTSDDTVAFDVYYWAAYYPDGIGVTFTPDYTGTVNGVIMYDSTDATKASLTIQGNGTFGGVVASSGSTNTPNIAISGGTFPAGQNYIVPGMEQDETGKIVIDTDTAVAEINGVGYTSLTAALNAASDGQTVKLLANSAGNTLVKIEDGRKLTLDMNGFNAGFVQNGNISIYHGGLDIIGSGKLYEEAPYLAPVVIYGSDDPGAMDYTTVTVGKNVTLEGWSGLFIDQHDAHGATAYGIKATVNGTLHSVKDIQGYGGHALYVQGTIKATDGNVPEIILNGATLNTGLGNGMYLAGYAKTTITDSIITSNSENSTGIEIRAGELTINGNTTVKGGTGEFVADPNGNGSTSNNVALAVVQHTTKLPVIVTVEGGTFSGGAAIYQADEQDNGDEAVAKVQISVKNGTFKGAVYSENKIDFVSGGHFSESVDEKYLDNSLNAELKSASNPEAPYSYYTRMDDAIAAAKPGDVVTPIPTDPATKTYIVTLDYNDGRTGNVTCTVEEDTSISLPRPTRSGYNFLGWYAGSTKVSSPYKVTGNVTLVAQWSYIDQGGGTTEPSGEYLVNVDRTTGGKVTVTPSRANKGDTVTITVKPNDGYVLDELTVTAKNGGSVKLTWKDDNKYTFTMPGSQVTVEATFVKEGGQTTNDLPFTDVTTSDWYYDAVEYVYENDLMNGTSATTFSPFVTTSRAMMLTILARYDGVDTSTGSTWYEAGAVWAIAEGVSDGTNLEANLTREQLVTMLWRYAGSPVVEGDLADYPDSASVSDWAVNAMIWAVENGVITGNGAGALNPQGTATRAEVATILMRFIEK